jgi:hypothetical protein
MGPRSRWRRHVTARSSCHVLVELAGRHPSSAATPGEIRVFATCRNERLRLPAFLNHYRSLGIGRFFIIDNDSTDGTTDYLAGQPDVHLFRTADRYSEAAMGTDWLNALLARFGVGWWCVTVDIDELFAYPGSEHASLHSLTKYLDRCGYDALSCLLLDLYPDGPLTQCAYQPGDDLLAAAPYFDIGPYDRSALDQCPGVLIKGGMRERVFHPDFRTRSLAARIYDALYYRVLRHVAWLGARPPHRPPLLTKVPLVRWDEKSRYLQGNHAVSRKIVAPDTGVLLHFKFLHDFHARAVQEATRGEHYDGASEYRRYAERLNQNPDMTFMYAGSTRYERTAQLVRLGLMRETQAWTDARAETSTAP